MHRRHDRVHPVGAGKEVLQVAGGHDVLDAKRGDDKAAKHGPFHLAADVNRAVGVCGKNKHHHPAFGNAAEDGLSPTLARVDVAGSHPAADSAGFQRGADLVGDLLILELWLMKTSRPMSLNEYIVPPCMAAMNGQHG